MIRAVGEASLECDVDANPIFAKAAIGQSVQAKEFLKAVGSSILEGFRALARGAG